MAWQVSQQTVDNIPKQQRGQIPLLPKLATGFRFLIIATPFTTHTEISLQAGVTGDA
jgi:secreted protein with Ig-like and vWFA domain